MGFNFTKWFKNLERVQNDGIVGECPSCKSPDTDYMYYIGMNDHFGLDVWCNACGKRIHVDGKGVIVNRKCIVLNQDKTAKQQVTT